MTDTIMDVQRGAFADGCTNLYCANNPNSRGTYEAYAGYLCADCEAEEEQDRRDRNTEPMGDDDE